MVDFRVTDHQRRQNTDDVLPRGHGQQAMVVAQARHEVRWEWIKGHAGHPENERADELARAGMEPFKPAKQK